MTTYLLTTNNRVVCVLQGPVGKDLDNLWDIFKTNPEVNMYNFADLFARYLVIHHGFIIIMDYKFVQLTL